MMHLIEQSKACIQLTNNYVEAPYESVFDFDQGDDFTVSFWMYSIGAVNSFMIMHNSGTVSTGAGWNIFCDTSGRIEIRCVDGAGGTSRFRTAARAQNTWNHYVFTKSGGNPNTASKFRCWVNGQRIGLTTVASTYNTALSMSNNSGLRIGGYTANFTNNFKVRDIQIYNRVLDQYEVRRLYNSGRNTRPLIYSKGLIPQGHYVYNPKQYRQPAGTGTTIYFRNEISKLYDIVGSVTNESTQINTIEGASAPSIPYTYSGRSMSFKNLVNYTQGNFNDVYNTLYKNSGGGLNYSHAASVKKITGNGRVKVSQLVLSTTARIVFMCLHNTNTLPTNPNTSVMSIGWGNTGASLGRQFIENGVSTNSSATANSGERCIIEVNFDTDVVTATYYNFSTVVATFTSTTPASTLFPTQEWYICPLTFQNDNDTTYQQVYYVSVDTRVANPGTIENNDLI